MELKRYVLTTDGYIYKKKQVKQHKDANTTHIVSFGMVSYHLINIKKTSDNILDLVEVGDMLLRNDDFCYHIIVTDISNDTFYGEHESIWRGNKISHIWKRQSNGDYKRYEVKE